MSLRDCIDSAVAQGHITLEEGQALKRRYDALAANILSKGEARTRLVRELEAEALDRRRRALLTETRRRELVKNLFSHRNRKGQHDPAGALMAVLIHHGEARFEDIEHKRLAIQAQAQAEMEELLHEFRKGWLTGDLRRRRGETHVRLANVVRELFGETTGDARAKVLAESWSKVAEDLRQRFNAAGGAIGKLGKWGLPQSHSPEALIKAGFGEWSAFVRPRLDRERMLNPLTAARMTDDEIGEHLLEVYHQITTDGWISREPTGTQLKSGLFSQHADHRYLHFKNADAWLEYQRNFGEGDPYAAMMLHLSTMARDIAAMEILGPNPEAMLKYLKDQVKQHAALAAAGHPDAIGPTVADPRQRAVSSIHRADEMWSHMRGSASSPINTKLANTVEGARNIVVSASLGSAAITALGDVTTDAVTRGFTGLPIIGALTDTLKMFSTANRREAVRAGLILDSALSAMHQQARYVGSVSTRTWTGFLADRTVSLSGLSPITQARKLAFGLAFQAEYADRVGLPMAQLPAALRSNLERHGITADEWDLIRASALYEPEPGATFLRPNEISQGPGGRPLADKYLAMILRERAFAVIEGNVASRSFMLSENQPGTFTGSLLRSMAMFKSFGVAMVTLHGERLVREFMMRPARGAVYAGGLLIGSTIIGVMVMQLKELAGGRDPRDMKDPKLWGAALLQGGGMGIYGDFLFGDVNRFGGGLAATVGGPMIDRLDNLRRLTIGNVMEFAEGKDKTNVGRELVQFMRLNTPGSSLWFSRLAYERILLDQLQHLIDPAARNAFRRKMQFRKTQFGNEYWWRPGETTPRRAPVLAQ